MIGKILFTIVVILVILAVARGRGRVPAVASSSRKSEPASRWPRYLAYGFVALVIGVGATVFYMDWQERNAVLTVKVVNSRTGLSSSYRVKRGEMRGRTFTTLDGVTVTLADEERVEVTDRAGSTPVDGTAGEADR